jgi:hypothetical protein
MSPEKEQRLIKLLQGMIIERQRLLIREANYLRGLVGLPPVKAEERKGEGEEGQAGRQ